MCGTFGVTSHIPQLFLCSGPLPSWGPFLRLLGKGRGGRSQEGAWPGVPGLGLRVVGVLGASLPGSSEHQACHLQAGLGSAGSQEQRLALPSGESLLESVHCRRLWFPGTGFSNGLAINQSRQLFIVRCAPELERFFLNYSLEVSSK